jgi:Tol biopolymer transport system component
MRSSSVATFCFASLASLGTFAAAQAAPERTELVSELQVVSTSRTGDGESTAETAHSISRDGRFVVFASFVDGLVPGHEVTQLQTIGLFLRDRLTGTTTLLHYNGRPIGAAEGSISDDGRFVAFVTFPQTLGLPFSQTEQVFVFDTQTGTLKLLSAGLNHTLANGGSLQPMISGDGFHVVYTSDASNLVSGDTNQARDVFVSDRLSGATRRVSVTSNGKQGAALFDSQTGYISRTGRYVTFESFNTFTANAPSGGFKVYLADLSTGRVELESVNSRGAPADSDCSGSSVSEDGRFVAFASQASNLAPAGAVSGNPSQIYVRDRQSGTTLLASISSAGEAESLSAQTARISDSGRYVVFTAGGGNLEPHDTNNQADVYVHDMRTGSTHRVSIASDGSQADGPSRFPYSISSDDRWIAFNSQAGNLVSDDLNGNGDVFVHENVPRTVLRVNAGGPALTDHLGRQWVADRGFNTGQTSRVSATIANTSDQALYLDQRFDAPTSPELHYQFAVPAGRYLVRLHFAETAPGNFAAGRRVFDVKIEGSTVLNAFDVFAAVGARRALVKEFETTVADGTLDIDFRHRKENPIIAAIEIIQL